VLSLLFSGCSTEKNTGLRRTYHNITTRYNVLFNAKESYRSGIRKAEESKQYDYTNILPLFLYGDEAVAQTIGGDMEAAARKATKAINFHSIKVKPKVNKSGMTAAERQFFNRREFNKYMDECYLLIGKSYVYTGQYFMALQTFNFMLTEFSDEPSLYEVNIWRAKALIQERNYREAEQILTELRDDDKFPDKKVLKSEFAAATADMFIRQQRYRDAIDYLEKAISNTRHKKTGMRYRYVLAQLYLEQKDYMQASANFRKVIRMNPPYEMSFNATISLATSSRSGDTDVNDVKKQLSKMLNDSKNTEYHDQIYYALAEIELHQGNTDKAIDYFQKSAHSSTVNIPQKTKSYLTLGNLFYDRRDYIPAQAYYDSAMINMQPDYPNYVQISAKAKHLNALVENLNTVHFQDSVQRIALMSETDRNRLIGNIITELQRKEQMQKEAEAIRMQQYYSNLSRRSTLPDHTSKAQWYFYNPATVNQGIGEFQVRWGRRTLEDNWRRKNKANTMDMDIAGNDADTEDADSQNGKVSDVYDRNYYLQNIPLTDSLMQVSHAKILESLYAAGYIYNNDFGEYALAARQYEDLIRRYPQSEYVIPSYYYLYRLYTQMGDAANTEKYKNLLLTEAPESTFAKIILDPTYLDRMAREKGEAEQVYEQAYGKYKNGEYDSVISLSEDAINRFPTDVLKPKFAFLKGVSTGKLNDTGTMREEMKKIIADYPNDEMAKEAQVLIDYIDGKDPELKRAEQIEHAEALYTYSEEGPYYFVWVIQSNEDINQLTFDILNFNLDNFPNSKLEVIRNSLNDSRTMLLVRQFPEMEQAQGYYRSFLMNPEATIKNSKYEHFSFIITEKNYFILEQDRKVEDYLEFFKKEYLRQ
jgi:tetratricopeptide (TPR) repeat protein